MSTDKSNQTDSCRSIAHSAGVIGIATLCSRLLGFVRDMTIARLFGVYLYAQAFVVAFKIPNLFRDLLGKERQTRLLSRFLTNIRPSILKKSSGNWRISF